jgi:hypothetical protein
MERGILFLSVKSPFCAWFDSISRIISSCHRPPKGDFIEILSSDCHANLIAFLRLYSCNNRVHIFLNMSILIHCWNRLRWHVEPEPNSEGNIFHWQPVLRTYRIPSSTFLYGIMGRPIVLLVFGMAICYLFYPTIHLKS